MSPEASIKFFLGYLHKNPSLRMQICAAPNKTILYAGHFFKPIWQELSELKLINVNFANRESLPDVLARISCPGQPFPDLLTWAKHLDHLTPWKENGFIVWRALSGIYAANAIGAVSFYIGSDVAKDNKVFAATELSVLARNPNIDGVTRDILAYYQRCIQTKQTSMNFGFIAS